MLILAFESSAKAASVALCRDGHLVSQYSQCSALTHSRTLLPMAEDMLKNAELTIGDIDAFAVAHGPGSFTGIRIGVSTVKGLAWASDKPCVGVSTLEAMAWHGVSAGGYICPVMDARRHQFYNAVFVNGVKVTPDRCAAFENIYAELKAIGKKVLLCGDGAPLFKSLCPDDGDIILPPVTCTDQNAVSVALCGYDAFINGKALKQNVLQPIYLRASQAERTLSERNNKDK